MPQYDVLVLGGGNAGMCAALAAREYGASVLVVECAPKTFRGGNSRHTRNLRCMHDVPTALLAGKYGADEFYDDVLHVTGGRTDDALTRLTIQESVACESWMMRHGARFQPALGGTLHLDRTNLFFLGGGKALLNAYYAAAERAGVEILYDTEVVDLDIAGGKFESTTIVKDGQSQTIRAKTVVAAAGGFEANLEWLKEAWGDAAENFLVRGTPYNKGKVLKLLLDGGAQPVGDPKQCHAVAIDARAPKFDGGIATRLDCVSLGIVVNRNAERFYDEGEDFWPKRYAIWGRLVADQPGQIAYAIVDAKAVGKFMPSMFPPLTANSIAELASLLTLPPVRLEATVNAFNRAVQPGTFDHATLDDCRTRGLAPDKTHWARSLDTPPFLAFPMRPGITFTYLGVKVDSSAAVVMANGARAENIFAAGEIMAGNILGAGYVAGIGMTIGTVFGRIAGQEAATHATA